MLPMRMKNVVAKRMGSFIFTLFSTKIKTLLLLFSVD